MDVKEAVRKAKEYIEDLYADEQIAQVGLEEVEFERQSNDWKITIGFVRPWDLMPTFAEISQTNQNRFLASARGERRQARYYKVLRIDDNNGDVKSLTDRLLNDPK